jgi:uncharacterized protein YecA (UPF0149 family)
MTPEQPKRTIDERLDALTQSVELLASLHHDNEQKIAGYFSKTNEEFTETEKQIRQLSNFIHAVSQMVLDHEERLKSIEDGEKKNENQKAHKDDNGEGPTSN